MIRNTRSKEVNNHGAPHEIPRKCVVIRKKQVGENVEKIELRYVSYSLIQKGKPSTTTQIVKDASRYFRERAVDLNYEDAKSVTRTCSTTRVSANCNDKEKKKLQQCLPILMSIRARFAETESNRANCGSKRNQSGAMKSLCDEIMTEAHYVLDNGHPVSGELIKKIANINSLCRKMMANESRMECLVQDEEELAASKSKTSCKFK